MSTPPSGSHFRGVLRVPEAISGGHDRGRRSNCAAKCCQNRWPTVGHLLGCPIPLGQIGLAEKRNLEILSYALTLQYCSVGV